MDLDKYGAWAVAFGLLLVTFREVIITVLKGKEPSAQRPDALTELARALDKLASVLERLEKSQDRALADLAVSQRDVMRLLTEIRAKQGGGD